MSCPDCLTVRCQWHLRNTKRPKTKAVAYRRALIFSSAKHWLRQWRRAERRFGAARSERRSVQAKITYARKQNTGALNAVNRLSTRNMAAEREFKLAEKDVAGQQKKFASCMRSILENK